MFIMKKLLLIALCISISLNMLAQKVIENPTHENIPVGRNR